LTWILTFPPIIRNNYGDGSNPTNLNPNPLAHSSSRHYHPNAGTFETFVPSIRLQNSQTPHLRIGACNPSKRLDSLPSRTPPDHLRLPQDVDKLHQLIQVGVSLDSENTLSNSLLDIL